jgi:drug/metabolite transporter (DMT)-like permease
MTHAGALIALHAAVALFAMAGLFGKWLALSALAIVLGRTVVAAATLALASAWRREPPGLPDRAMVANGAILALHWVAFFLAIQASSVAIGLLGYASFPLFVLLLERRGATQAVTRDEWACALLVVAGFAVLVPRLAWSDATVQGLAFGAVSGFTFAVLAVRNRSLLRARRPIGLALWQNTFAAAWLAGAALVVGGTPRLPTPAELGALVVLGAACTALAHTLFIASLRRVSAQVASIIAGLEPVYGIAFAAVLLGEAPGVRELAGATLLVAAALVASRRPAAA